MKSKTPPPPVHLLATNGDHECGAPGGTSVPWTRRSEATCLECMRVVAGKISGKIVKLRTEPGGGGGR